MRHLCVALSAAFILLFCRSAQAQDSAVPRIGSMWSEQIGCSLPSNTNPMEVTLPLDVLDHLERMSSSVFVHAFLIRYIAEDNAGKHRLSECARNLLKAELTDFGSLRGNLPDAPAIIEALRTAERARLRTVELRDSARTLPLVVARLLADTSAASLELASTQLASADSFCAGDNSGACGTLKNAIRQLSTLRTARATLDRASELARQTAEEADRAAEKARTTADRLATDSLRLAGLAASATAADSTAREELRANIARWTDELMTLDTEREAALARASTATVERQRAEQEAGSAHTGLRTLLQSLQDDLQKAGEKLAQHTVAALEGSQIATAFNAVTAPPAQAADANPSAHSANLLLELTDFIIERMRREAVNSFIVNLHLLARNQPLMQHGFPETWGLMQGLSMRKDSTLNAVAVGRIPLTAWRATLADDFVTLPINLLQAGGVAICRGGERAPSESLRARAEQGREACRKRVAELAPLVPVATRLLEGEGVFNILRDAASFATREGPDLPGEWRRVSQGLTVLSTLAETWLIQGHVPAADPTRHPYLLTAQSLTAVPQPQREAFVRLLLVDAIPTLADMPADVKYTPFFNAVTGATRVLERIASRPVTGELRPADAGMVLRSTFEALVSAADVARVFAPGDAGAWLDPLRTRWRAVSGTLEPIVAGNFGLALSRTTVLIRDLHGGEVPGPVLTLAALASSLSEAQNGAQVRHAFEAAASPVGGWQGKRYGEGGGSITAFPGMAFGWEHLETRSGDPEGAGDNAKVLGASLPIGLEWQIKLSAAAGSSPPDCWMLVCGIGVFVPLIDLGALLSYRLDGSDSVESEPNANFRQVFAPGAYFSLALTRNVPVNLLLGGQLMPSLRTVTDTEGETAKRSAIRWGVGIGMDILLLKF